MAEVPPTFWLPFAQLTSMVRYVSPDHTTEISMAPVPVNPYWFDVCTGGSR